MSLLFIDERAMMLSPPLVRCSMVVRNCYQHRPDFLLFIYNTIPNTSYVVSGLSYRSGYILA